MHNSVVVHHSVCVWSVVSFPLLVLVAFNFGVVFVFFFLVSISTIVSVW